MQDRGELLRRVIGRVVTARDNKIGFANLQSLRPGDPLFSAVKAALGDYDGRPGIDAFPQRPFGMQRKIYARLRTQAEVIEHQLRQGRVYVPRVRKKYDVTRSVCC
jgi:hypothetical protein